MEKFRSISFLAFGLFGNVIDFLLLVSQVTVTDLPAYWRQPPKRIREDLYKRVENLSYGKITKRFYDTQPTRSRQDFMNLLVDLKSDGVNAVVLHSNCDGINFCCNQCANNWIPDEIMINKNILLQGHFNIVNELKSLSDLRDNAQNIHLALTPHDVDRVEQLTRAQCKSELWHYVRIGRITASTLKTVVHTSNETPPPRRSTLKTICHPYLNRVETPATLYGRRNEVLARQQLTKVWSSDHQNGQITECGVFLSSDHPYMAATPDAIGTCACCGKFSVEIKCPFRLNANCNLDSQLPINDLATKPNTFLQMNEDGIELVRTHEYFYQVQAQIFLTKSDFGVFVVWSKSEMLVLKIAKDVCFWNRCVERCHLYFMKIVMPELLGNFYTRSIK